MGAWACDNQLSVSAGSSRNLGIPLIGGVLAVVFLTFQGVLGHEFVHYDDAFNIYDNPHVSSLSWDNIYWMFTDTMYGPRYMPLGWLCYALDRHLFGLNPTIWHAGNLLVHLLNTALLFCLLKQLILLAGRHRGSTEQEPMANWCASIAALWWAVNPLRVETVAWASARIYEVAVTFALVWLNAWLRTQGATVPPRQRRYWDWLALGAYGASLLTYPLALFAPVALFVLDVYPLRRGPAALRAWFKRECWHLWRDKVPFFLVSATILLLTVVVRIYTDPRFRPPTLGEFAAFDRLMQACYVLAYYVWKPWLPLDLSAAYPTLHAFNPLGWKFLASAGFATLTTLLALRWRRRWPVLLAIWICHASVLLPVLGLSEYPHSAFDRYSLLHGLLWAAAMAGALCAVWNSRRHRLLAGGGMILVSLGSALLSVAYVPVWKNTVSVYSNILERFGDNPGRGRFDEALGVSYLRNGETNKAVQRFTAAIYYETHRADRHIYVEGIVPRCYWRLAEIDRGHGNLAEAAVHFTAALNAEHDPSRCVGLTLELSDTLTRCGRSAEALPWLERAVQLAPENPALHSELGALFARLGNAAESRRHLDEARRLKAAEEKTPRS